MRFFSSILFMYDKEFFRHVILTILKSQAYYFITIGDKLLELPGGWTDRFGEIVSKLISYKGLK